MSLNHIERIQDNQWILMNHVVGNNHGPEETYDRRRCSQPCRGLKVIAVTEEVWPLNTEIGTPSGNLHCTTRQPPYIKCFQTQYATHLIVCPPIVSTQNRFWKSKP